MNPAPPQDPNPKRRGIRLSATDAVVLLAGALLTFWLHRRAFPLWWTVPMVLGHFFLFCNVFLVRRKLELVWAGVFFLNATLHFFLGKWDAWPACGWQVPVSIFVIVRELLSPSYHGVGSRRA